MWAMCVSFCAIKENSSAASRSRGDWVFFWVQPCCNSLDHWCRTTAFWNTEKNWKRSHRIEISNCFLRVALPKNKKLPGLLMSRKFHGNCICQFTGAIQDQICSHLQ